MWKLFSASITVAMLAFAWPAEEAKADAYGCEDSAKYCFVAEYCKDDTNRKTCGSIAYINKGGYAVNPVILETLSSQPSDKATISPACKNIDMKSTADVDLGQYLQFIVPGECALKLKIKILAGTNKDRNLFLTPGCVIEAKTDGTTLQNEWHISTSWAPSAKNAGYSGTVQDGQGNKCGNLNKM
jgi:hypothetical protein